MTNLRKLIRLRKKYVKPFLSFFGVFEGSKERIVSAVEVNEVSWTTHVARSTVDGEEYKRSCK